MNKSELIAYVKSDSIENLVCASGIKTQADIDKMKDDGYSVGFTEDKFKKTFPKLNPEKIYYNKGIHQTFYYDKENLVLFPIDLYGNQTLKPYNEFEDEVIMRAEELEANVKDCNFFSPLLMLGDRMRMEMLNLIVEQGRCNRLYDLFENFYQTSDYGCNLITSDSMKKLLAMKSPEQREHTETLLKSYPDRVIIYRGEGDKSASWKESMSWTTDINVANFFASRFESKNAVIHVAEVEKENISEYFTTEKECIVLPENVHYIKEMKLQGVNLIEEVLPKVTEQYQYYRDLALDYLNFRIDDNEHGRLHTLRVLMNTLIISDMKGLSEEDTNILCTAAIFHDTQRDNNGEDTKHGEASAEYYERFADNYPEYVEFNEITQQIIKYHCLPDEVGHEAIKEENWYLFDIFKDSDALDRVRFGIRDLDLNQLRTDEAKSLTMVSNIMLQGISIPEPNFEQGMDLM